MRGIKPDLFSCFRPLTRTTDFNWRVPKPSFSKKRTHLVSLSLSIPILFYCKAIVKRLYRGLGITLSEDLVHSLTAYLISICYFSICVALFYHLANLRVAAFSYLSYGFLHISTGIAWCRASVYGNVGIYDYSPSVRG